MDINVRDTLFIKGADGEHVVRAGTRGVEVKKVVYFYDTTRTLAVGVSRDACLEDSALFKVTRTLSDREVSLKDVLEVVGKVEDNEIREKLTEALQAL